MFRSALALVFTLACSTPALAQAPSGVVVYEGGHVWTGAGFERADLATRGDRIVAIEEAGSTARRVSVTGRFLTPAYGNAHLHVTAPTVEGSRSHTDVGVYYAWNLNSIVISRSTRAVHARPDVYDVRYAMGGITEPGGHPERLYVRDLGPRIYQGRSLDWFVGNAFHYGASPRQIDEAIARLVEQGAQMVKVMLGNAEHYEALRDDPAAYGTKGLNPRNLPHLVRRAHEAGLPVMVHVETAFDLQVAATSGADVAAHLPGYYNDAADDIEAKRITPEIAAVVARSGMKVVPTYSLFGNAVTSGYLAADAPQVAPGLAVQAHNIRILKEAGVPILLGTDAGPEIWGEAEHLVTLGAMTAQEAARAAFATSAALFEDRRIGCLQPGCEADFLVLEADPTVDVRALRTIQSRVMQGRPLEGAVPPAP